MLTLAFWLLLVAALGGATMAALDGATRLLRLGHGAIAGLGLLTLLVGALMHPGVWVWSAFALLAIGFGAGAVLFGVIWRDRAPPRAFIFGHGLINALGVIVLGITVFG